MIKRMNKVTSLLIAAAAVVSLMPATGVNAADRLETKEGTIESAVAFSDGNYIYDGYKTADQENALYYNVDNTDKLIEDVNASSINNYGDKYAKVMDGADEYLVDLSTGKVVDESTEDKKDNAGTKLKTALKKTDRYGESIIATSSQLTTLDETKLADVWYKYAVNPTDGSLANNDVSGTLYGYTNEAGKYIDVSNVANVYAYSSAKGKVVKIEEFSNAVNDTDSDTKLQATLIQAPKYLAQDKDNIYQSVKVRITDTNTVTETAATAAQLTAAASAVATAQTAYTAASTQIAALNTAVITAQTNLATANAAVVTAQTDLAAAKADPTKTVADITTAEGVVTTAQADVVVKIAAVATAQAAVDTAIADSVTLKAAKATLDAAIAEQTRLTNLGTPQAVTTRTTTYIQKISKAQGETKDDAYLPKTVESYEVSKNYDSSDADDASDVVDTATSYQVTNGTLYAIESTSTNVQVTTMKLVKDKVKFDTANVPAGFNAADKVDVYMVEKGVDDDTDVEQGNKSYSVDVNGNIWAINEGKIMEFVNGKFEDKFTCDTTLDELNVYDENSLVAWNNSGDIYATVDKQATETPVETPVTTTGWVNTATGWTFFNTDGSQVKGQWVKDGGVWYMIKADGIMATGWYNDNGTWYFLNTSGAMKTGWVLDGSTWYFLQSSGAMKTGWLNDNGTWYYLNASGAMAANTTVDGYKLNASGAWVK